jgi:hypothetical protein
LEWLADDEQPSLAYHVYRGKPGDKAFERLTAEPIRDTCYSDPTAQVGTAYAYGVRSVSGRGVESAASEPATAAARVIREAVFTAPDVRGGRSARFPHRPEFDLGQPLTLECWVRFDRPGKMPVVVSCGLWRTAGWFLQSIGGRWRWHVGGLDCDGGRSEPGRWTHLAAIFDGGALRLFQDGRRVAERSGEINRALWSGDLYVGQYSGMPGPDFQVFGCVAGVKIYHRPLAPAEIAAAANGRPSE